MKIEIKGRVHSVGATVQITETFKKRQVVIKLDDTWKDREGNININSYYLGVDFLNDKCSYLDNVEPGNIVECTAILKGRLYEKNGEENVFNGITGISIQAVEYEHAAPEVPASFHAEVAEQAPADDDLPF